MKRKRFIAILPASHSRVNQSPFEVEITLNSHVPVDKKQVEKSSNWLLFHHGGWPKSKKLLTTMGNGVQDRVSKGDSGKFFLESSDRQNLDEKPIFPSLASLIGLARLIS